MGKYTQTQNQRRRWSSKSSDSSKHWFFIIDCLQHWYSINISSALPIIDLWKVHKAKIKDIIDRPEHDFATRHTSPKLASPRWLLHRSKPCSLVHHLKLPTTEARRAWLHPQNVNSQSTQIQESSPTPRQSTASKPNKAQATIKAARISAASSQASNNLLLERKYTKAILWLEGAKEDTN